MLLLPIEFTKEDRKRYTNGLQNGHSTCLGAIIFNVTILINKLKDTCLDQDKKSK